MAKALEVLFTPMTKVAIALSRLVAPARRLRKGERRQGDRRSKARKATRAKPRRA